MLQNHQQSENRNQQQNPIIGAQPQLNEKKRSKPFALKPQNFQTRKGLRKLHELTNQVNWNDQMTIENAMNIAVLTLKNWQYQIAPKYSYDYFIQRCQALGSNKVVSAYLNKVRRIHKGLEQWQEVEEIVGDKKEENKQENFHSQIEIASNIGVDHEKKGKFQLDELLDEDLLLFEEMNRKKNEKKNYQEDQEGQGLQLGMQEDFGIDFYDDEM